MNCKTRLLCELILKQVKFQQAVCSDNLELNIKEINLIRTYFTFAIQRFQCEMLYKCSKTNVLGTNMSQKHDY